MAALEQHYTELFHKHGDTPQAVQWRDRASQERRFEILAQVGLPSNAKVLDFGCGTGHLLEYMRREHEFKGEFVGYDLTADTVAAAQAKFPAARFERRDIFADGIGEEFDYVFISGVFNNLMTDNAGFMHEVLELLFGHSRRALAFNALSAYVDFFDPGLCYTKPEEVFHFCKERLSPLVTLRHDYFIKPGVVPYEFTMYVHRCDLTPREVLQR
jgi:cyclopropane fatty-acyl-phospholipid synthase-like methyltransferase